MKFLYIFLVPLILGMVTCFTNPNDFTVLNDFRNGLQNPYLLQWPDKGNDPCGPPLWPHVFCANGRVTQIQVQGLGLKGHLPVNLNQLKMLQNVGLQKNNFSGILPSFSGLSNLQYAYLDFNDFDTIPADFFNGLTSIRVLALDNNPFNQSFGWSLPSELGEFTQLANFSCSNCNLVGEIPDFFGILSSLSVLKLSGNAFTGEIPSSFASSMLQILCLNDQNGDGLSGTIEVIGSMVGLTKLWLHGNQFTGPIPDNIGNLTSLKEVRLNSNQLVGLIPQGLSNLNIQVLDLSNNMLMGSIPKFRVADITLEPNSFCSDVPGQQCAPSVNALLEFLHDLNYPKILTSDWTGNDPCSKPWWGITCIHNQVSIINLPNLGLNGTLSPSLGDLTSLVGIHLEGNRLEGVVPENLTRLRSLKLLNVSGNDFEPPLPEFDTVVIFVIDGNHKLLRDTPSPAPELPFLHPNESLAPDLGLSPSSENGRQTNSSASPDSSMDPTLQNSKDPRVVAILVVASACVGFSALAIVVSVICIRKGIKKNLKKSSSVTAMDPKDSSDPDDMIKIAIQDAFSKEAHQGSCKVSKVSDPLNNDQVIEVVNPVFSFQLLQRVTNNFARENELGRGGFGVVYRGKLDDGKEIAVKRMEAGLVGSKGLSEFQAEIASLSKLRHRNLVSLLGYSIEGTERLLVYEYMPKGALSRHLFRWKILKLEPLPWTTRLAIALDVAKGVEYLHSLTEQSFIHRDLKSANILLDDGFRAKVSDFGLVKLVPDKGRSVATRLAGTFGYLAPEYAVMGKVTTKVDVFSFGVILMELLTGSPALDAHRPEEDQYLVNWFLTRKSNKSDLIASIDPALGANEEIYQSIHIMAELAALCTIKEPNHRPEMGYIANVLARLVDTWKPYQEIDHTSESYASFALTPLPLLLKAWQEDTSRSDYSRTSRETKDVSSSKSPEFTDSFYSIYDR